MNKHLKTLLLVSTIILPLSACGHLHHKGETGSMKQCKVSRNLEDAKKHLVTVTADLQAASTEAKDAGFKKHLGKLAKESEKLSANIDKSIGICKKSCDAKREEKADAKKPASKQSHKKAHHAKPVAPAAK